MLNGYTFPGQTVPAKIDGSIYNFYIPKNGILKGMEMSLSEDTLTIQPGLMITYGRVIGSDGVTQQTLTEIPTSGYAQIVLTIDTTKTATTTEFDQLSLSTVYSSTLSGFPALTQQDINDPYGSGTIYQEELAVIEITGGNLTAITRSIGAADTLTKSAEALTYSATFLASGWSSSAPYTQTVTIEGLLSSDTPIVDILLSSDTATAEQELISYGYFSKFTAGNNSLTATALSTVPTQDITVQLTVIRG